MYIVLRYQGVINWLCTLKNEYKAAIDSNSNAGGC